MCEFALSWRIMKGRWGNLELSGLSVVLAGFYRDDEPGKPWRVCLYVDEQATSAQHEALAKIFLGQAGGTPFRNFARAISEVYAVRPAKIELEHKPRRWLIRASDYVSVRATVPVSSDLPISCGIPGFDQPGEELRTELMRVEDHPLGWEVYGRCGFVSDFDYLSVSVAEHFTSQQPAMRNAVIGAVVTAAVSTVGDYLWANVLPHGQPVYWFAHAIVLFLTVGACLGWPTGKPLAGAIGAALIGCAATLGFYFLQPLMGYSAMFVLFVALWVALGMLTGRVLQRQASIGAVFTRSVLAAVGSGVGFYAISGIWMPFNPHGWDYARHFVSWTIAYFPGFGAVLIQNSRSSLRR